MLAMVRPWGRPACSRRRLGVALVIVLTLVLLTAFFAGFWFFLASGEKDRTQTHTHEIEATVIGEGVASRIAAMVEQFAWSERFYLRLGRQGKPFLFNSSSFPFQMHGGLFATGDATFTGSIYDHPTMPYTYRIVMEIAVRGCKVLMTWDRVYPQGLMSATNDDGNLLSSHVDSPGSGTIDQLIDEIRDNARNNRGEGELADTGLSGEIDGRRSGANPGRSLLDGANSNSRKP